MDIDFALGNLVSFVNGLTAGLEFKLADLITAIGSGSGSLGGAPEVPVTP